MAIVEPHLSSLDPSKAVGQVGFALPHRLHFRAGKLNAGLKKLDQFIIVPGPAVLCDDFDRRLVRRSGLLACLLAFLCFGHEPAFVPAAPAALSHSRLRTFFTAPSARTLPPSPR